MSASSADVPTVNAARYIDQLCRHWSHKLEVEASAGRARIVMPSGATVSLVAEPERLRVAIEASNPAGLAETQEVVRAHLDRFAFREAPLRFDWEASAA